MLGSAGMTVTPRPVQQRQVSLRFTDEQFRRLDRAARNRDMGKSTLAQRLVLEWLDWLDSREGDE